MSAGAGGISGEGDGVKTKSFYHLPLSSLQWLLTGLFLAVLPLWLQLPPALIFGFLGCLVWRFVLERRGLKIPGIWLRCGVGIVGLLMILGLHNGSLVGLVPGMSLLLLLIALKVLEMRTEREFMLLGFLAFFILLTSLFFSQTLLLCLYVGVVFVILSATVVHFTGGAAEGFRLWPLLRYTGLLVLQATPLIVLLFIFLPRLKAGLLFQITKPGTGQSGMSEQVNPGSFSELAMSEEVAFRADFPEEPMPPYNDLYWRVGVFTKCNGLAWQREAGNREVLRRPMLTGKRVVQRISMEPHIGGWAYGLDHPDMPLASDGPIFLSSGNVLSLKNPSSDRMNQIRVVSRIGNDQTPLSPEARLALTEVPENVGQRSRQLVNSWLQKTHDPRAIVGLALQMFRSENFHYTLTPGSYSADGLDEFLFDRHLGFCEHYAAAFATLMRLAGVPARMVAGYHGGEPNPFSDYLIIRQSDAHAWAEVWIEGQGWMRFDPADAINPSRMDADTQLASRHTDAEESGRELRVSRVMPDFLQKMLHSARLGWDMVDFQWNLRVLSYDQSSQREFYHALGINSPISWKLVAILLGGILGILSAIYLVSRRKPEAKDRPLVMYRDFCKLLERSGISRQPSEGPQDFARRAAEILPEEAPHLLALFELFIRVRYGKSAPPGEFREIAARLQQLKRALRGKKGLRLARSGTNHTPQNP